MSTGGGYGKGPWGGVGWGTAGQEDDNEVAANETVPTSESVSAVIPLRLLDANASTAFLVLLTFNHALDPLYAPNFDPASFDTPGLTITSVTPGVSPNQLWLHTSEQVGTIYTLTVLDAQGIYGGAIDPAWDQATFAGFPIEPTFYAAAQSTTKVELVFSTAMLQNAAYSTPASYSVMDLNGTSYPILSATPVGPNPNSHLSLTLGTPLTAGGYYVASILSPLVQTATNLQIDPPTDLFQWNPATKPSGTARFNVKLSDFSGEVTGGILGDPAGLVFFSPSLEAAAPTSAIQVEDVSVCTRAYDVYTPPAPLDPNPLYTWNSNGPAGILGGAVLFAPFDRLLGAKLDLALLPSDALGPYLDGPAVAVLAQPFDPAYVSLLNNDYWAIFDGSVTPFITANNLGPIPPGPTQVITLQGLPVTEPLNGYGGEPWGGEGFG